MKQDRRQRNTQQRRIILEELQGVRSHPTAVDLYELVRHRLPKISLGTVYRNLELLSRQGTIRKLDFGGEEARFDGDLMRHEHVRCVRCGRMEIFTAPHLTCRWVRPMIAAVTKSLVIAFSTRAFVPHVRPAARLRTIAAAGRRNCFST